jgi:hypothetical protein
MTSRTPLAAVLLALTLAACGGGDGDTKATPSPSASSATASPTPSAMTKEAFVAAANAVCKDVLGKAAEFPDPQTPDEYVSTTEQYVTLLEDGQTRLKALQPPAEDAARWNEFVAANEQQVQIVRDMLPALRTAAEQGDQDGVEAEFATGFERFNEIAEEQAPWAEQYGLSEC